MPRQLPIDTAESLIAAVRKSEVLYNLGCEGYKNRNLTELAWKKVSDEVGRDVTFCRTTWAQLRATFNRILAHQKSKPSGSGADKVPRWYLYQQMSFLRNYVAHGNSVSNIAPAQCAMKLVKEEPATGMVDWVQLDLLPGPSPSTDSSVGTCASVEDTHYASPGDSLDLEILGAEQQEEVEETPCRAKAPGKRKRKTETDPVQHAFLELIASKKQRDEEDDPDLLLFKGILPMVKQMTQRNKVLFFQQVMGLCGEILDSQESA